MTDKNLNGAAAPDNTNKKPEESTETQGVGITVSGISGTKTLRVGRVNKRPKDSNSSESTPEASAVDKHVEPTQTVPSPVTDHVETKPTTVSPVEQKASDKKTEDNKSTQKETTAAASASASEPRLTTPVSTSNVDAPASAAETREKPISPAPTEQDTTVRSSTVVSPRPQGQDGYNSRPQGQGGYSPRPQGQDGYNSRPQGQGGYSPRPQGQDGYNSRPQGQGGYSPRPQGQDGYNSRPQGQGGYSPRPQGQDGYNSRPQGQGGYGPRPQGQGGYSPRPQGQDGYNSRPQGQGGYSPRPQGQDGYNSRPQGQGGYGSRPQGQGGYSPRPQGQDGYNSRPQGQGSYGPRPQGQGGYGPRPQGQGGYGPRPQGQGGYGSRPQGQGGFSGPRRSDFGQSKDDNFVRTKEDNGYASRNSSRGARPQHSGDAGPEVVEKEKANFAARDAYDKIRKDPAKETKKEAPKPGTTTVDRRNINKKAVSAAFSGRGASEILQDDSALDKFYPAGSKGRRPQRKKGQMGMQAAPKPVLSHVSLPEYITIKEFSEGIQKRSADVIKKLMKLGVLATINQEIDFDTATLIAAEFGITTEQLVEVTEEDILFDDSEDQAENLIQRPPVVVVMGHVDHGKTSLLDKIRSTSVVKGEAGGITQHIGAYTVRLKGRQITFLDTPGHEAFTTMRARGAQVTDIAILVVAADDGVMPQTIEAINHAKAANTEIVVAINKIDKPGANLEKVKQELSQHGIIPEEWGGTTVMVPVSAKTGDGIDELLEMVLLTADILDLKADPHKQAKGTVIEAKLDKNRGPVATVLVQRGTLRSGDTIVTGPIVGRVRAMTDDKGASVKKAGPSIPVEVLGLPEVPDAGEIFYAVTDEKVARELVEKRRVKHREDQLRKSSRMSLETLAQNLAAGEVKDLNLIVKADVQGSVEAMVQALEKLSNEEVHVKVIHGGVGAITESDIVLADVSNAIIIGFNVRPGTGIAEKAKDSGVDIKLYRVIYSAIEDIEAAMRGMLKPKFEEVILGHVEIRQIFKVSNVGTIGGAYVTDGKIPRTAEVRVVRDGIVAHEGKLASLKRFKDDAREVAAGYECGISIDGFNDIREGDIIEAFEMREIAR